MRSYNEQIITLTYSCTRFGVLSRLSRLSRNSVEEANNASDRMGGRAGGREVADHVNGQANVPREPEINLTWDVAFVSLSLSLCAMTANCGQVEPQVGLAALYLRQSRPCRIHAWAYQRSRVPVIRPTEILWSGNVEQE